MQKISFDLKSSLQHVALLKDIGGFLWCFVYLAYFQVGLTEGLINWPLVGSAINIAWEFVFTVTSGDGSKRVFANHFFALCHMTLLIFMVRTRRDALVYLMTFVCSFLLFKKFQHKRSLKYAVGLGLNIAIPFYLATLPTQCGSSLHVHILKTLSNFLYAVGITNDPKIVNSSLSKYVAIGCFFVVFSEVCSLFAFQFVAEPCHV